MNENILNSTLRSAAIYQILSNGRTYGWFQKGVSGPTHCEGRNVADELNKLWRMEVNLEVSHE